jgi:hypothetical protein
MLNIPGTMLIVRRRTHGSGDPYYVNGSEDRDDDHGDRWPSMHIPYGDPCMMLSFEEITKQPGARQQRSVLKVLWDSKYVKLHLTGQQANTWFTYFTTWQNRGHEKRFEGFKETGKMDTLYRSIGLERPTTGLVNTLGEFVAGLPTIKK